MKYSPLTVAAVFAASVVAQNDKEGWAGTLSTLSGGLMGDVTVVNSTAIMIENYSVDPQAPALYWWGSKVKDLPAEGFRVSNHHVTEKASDETIMVMLDNDKTTDDFVYFGLYCETLKANFGQTKLTDSASSGNSSDSSDDSDSSDSSNDDGDSAAMGRNTGFAAAASVFVSAAVFAINML